VHVSSLVQELACSTGALTAALIVRAVRVTAW
jgi:hypothetical protein